MLQQLIICKIKFKSKYAAKNITAILATVQFWRQSLYECPKAPADPTLRVFTSLAFAENCLSWNGLF